MKTLQRAQGTSQVRAVNAEDLTVDIVASTFALDSYNTRIDPNGWVLDGFRKNPVICYQHDAGGGFFGPGANRGLPVAKALPSTVRVEGEKLVMKIQFMPAEVDEFSYKIFQMVRDGFLTGVSVGFDPMEWKDEETEGDGRVRIFTKQRLVETSIVTVPANDEAMVVRCRDLGRESELEQFRTLASEIASEYQRRSVETPEQAKHRSYFETKQPVNKLAGNVLEKLAKQHGIDLSGLEEKDAWTRIAAAVEETTEETVEEGVEEETPEEVTAEETPIEETPIEETTEETEEAVETSTEGGDVPPPETPSTPPAPEAPEPGRKASVQIPLNELPRLLRNVRQTCVEAAVEASRRGVPTRELPGVIDAVGAQLYASLAHPNP